MVGIAMVQQRVLTTHLNTYSKRCSIACTSSGLRLAQSLLTLVSSMLHPKNWASRGTAGLINDTEPTHDAAVLLYCSSHDLACCCSAGSVPYNALSACTRSAGGCSTDEPMIVESAVELHGRIMRSWSKCIHVDKHATLDSTIGKTHMLTETSQRCSPQQFPGVVAYGWIATYTVLS